MAHENPEPIANTAAFRAFNTSGSSSDEPATRRPSPIVWLTAVVLLIALIGGVLAFAL